MNIDPIHQRPGNLLHVALNHRLGTAALPRFVVEESAWRRAGYADRSAVLEYFGRALGRVRGPDFWSFFELALGVAAVVSLPWRVLVLWRFIRHGTPERSIKQIGRAVLEALEYEGSIDQHAGDFCVYADRNPDGSWRILREDYFAVPDVLARKKEFAEVFAQRWKSLVGPVQLVYTRTPEGRKMLLRARNHSLSGSFQDRAERVSCWK